MPYEEFASWQVYYMLEPFGFHDNEYRTAVLLTMLANVNASKKSQQKKVSDYVRNMLKLLEKTDHEMKLEEAVGEKYRTASKQEKMAMIEKAFRG